MKKIIAILLVCTCLFACIPVMSSIAEQASMIYAYNGEKVAKVAYPKEEAWRYMLYNYTHSGVTGAEINQETSIVYDTEISYLVPTGNSTASLSPRLDFTLEYYTTDSNNKATVQNIYFDSETFAVATTTKDTWHTWSGQLRFDYETAVEKVRTKQKLTPETPITITKIVYTNIVLTNGQAWQGTDTYLYVDGFSMKCGETQLAAWGSFEKLTTVDLAYGKSLGNYVEWSAPTMTVETLAENPASFIPKFNATNGENVLKIVPSAASDKVKIDISDYIGRIATVGNFTVSFKMRLGGEFKSEKIQPQFMLTGGASWNNGVSDMTEATVTSDAWTEYKYSGYFGTSSNAMTQVYLIFDQTNDNTNHLYIDDLYIKVGNDFEFRESFEGMKTEWLSTLTKNRIQRSSTNYNPAISVEKLGDGIVKEQVITGGQTVNGGKRALKAKREANNYYNLYFLTWNQSIMKTHTAGTSFNVTVALSYYTDKTTNPIDLQPAVCINVGSGKAGQEFIGSKTVKSVPGEWVSYTDTITVTFNSDTQIDAFGIKALNTYNSNDYKINFTIDDISLKTSLTGDTELVSLNGAYLGDFEYDLDSTSNLLTRTGAPRIVATNWYNQDAKNYEYIEGYEQSLKNEITLADADSGITFSPRLAWPTERIEVTIPEGKTLKAGGLKYSVNGKDYPLNLRVGSLVFDGKETNDEDNTQKYYFIMPEGDVTIKADFADENQQNLAVTGATFRDHSAEYTSGLQFASRIYRNYNEGETVYNLASTGTVVVRKDKMNGSGIDLSASTVDAAALESFMADASNKSKFKNVKTTKLLDRCADYVDFALRLTKITEAGFSDISYVAVAYGVYEDESGNKKTVYSAPISRSFSETKANINAIETIYKTMELGNFVNAVPYNFKLDTASDYYLTMESTVSTPTEGVAFKVALNNDYRMGIISGDNHYDMCNQQTVGDRTYSGHINEWYQDGDEIVIPKSDFYFRAYVTHKDNIDSQGAFTETTPLTDINATGFALKYVDNYDVIIDNATVLNDVVNAAKQNGATVIVHGSDPHGDNTRLDNMMMFADAIGADLTAITGDITAYNAYNGYSAMVNTIAKYNLPSAIVSGNHDVDGMLNEAEKYEKLYKDILNKNTEIVTGGTNKGYYYIDYADKNIRVIVLDSYEGVGETNAAWIKYTQAQIDFLINALNTDMRVMIAYHSPEYNPFIQGAEAPADSKFMQAYTTAESDAATTTQRGIIADIVDAFISKGTLSENYGSLSTNADFSNASGTFIAYMSGHTHRDAICYMPSTTNKQLVLGVPSLTANKGVWGGYSSLADNSDLIRDKSTKAQDCFNVYVVGADSSVKVYRIGATKTISGETRDTITIIHQ